MKVLTIHTVGDDDSTISAVDMWRIYRPWRELAKHVDWQIDASRTAIKEVEQYASHDDFTPDELQKSAEWLGQYDIVHSSYFTNAAQFTLLLTVQKLYGTKLVLDIDDDMFAINPDNPFWMRANHENVYDMQQMIKHVDFITTTTERLAHELRKRRSQPANTVIVLPNRISDDYQEGTPHNDQVVIGYFGGASHYRDLNETGCIEGLERVMHKHKDVRFVSAGMITSKYLPKARSSFVEGQKGHAWVKSLFPSLQFDIAIAPLEDTIFARSKSNIKWQEATRMGAAVVASDVGPYQALKHGQLAKLVKNDTESWEYALDELVSDTKARQAYVQRSRAELAKNRLEDHWQELKQAMEWVHKTPIMAERKIITEV